MLPYVKHRLHGCTADGFLGASLAMHINCWGSHCERRLQGAHTCIFSDIKHRYIVLALASQASTLSFELPYKHARCPGTQVPPSSCSLPGHALFGNVARL